MDEKIHSDLDAVRSADRLAQGKAFQDLMAATDRPVDWAYEAWDEVLAGLRDKDNHVRAIAAQHQSTAGGLLPALHAVQDALGHVPDEAVPVLAETFNLSRAEVHGVVTYYHHFRRTPPGRHIVEICRAEACKACGGDELLARAEALLACASHETRADGAVTLQPVYCLGLCASSPALRIDARLHARVTRERLDVLLAPIGVAQ